MARRDDEEELSEVEVERLPNLDGWEYFKADPEATGVLEGSRDAEKRWAKAFRRAVEGSEERALDTDARSEIALAILRQHDPTLDSYEHRLIFVLEPPPDEDEDEDDEDEDDEDEDDEDDDEGE